MPKFLTGLIRPGLLSGAIVVTFMALCLGAQARASVFPGHDQQDEILKEIGVDERLGATVSPGLSFTDQDGRKVLLGDYLKGGPVVLSLNYYECPMLCPIIFRNLADTIDGMKGLDLGRDFRVVTVSFNPNETLDMARDKSTETYAFLRGVKEPGKAWPFLFGDAANIAGLTKSVGFRFKEISPGVFAHPTALVVLSPDGKVTRYLYGVKQEQMDLRLALTEAAQGRIGASKALNNILLFCYHYDPAGRRYAIAATNIMKAGGALTLLILGTIVAVLVTRERVKKA